MKAKSTIFDRDARKSVIYGNVDVQSLIGPASMELVLMMSFNDAGDKVTRIDEFFDSAVYNSFFAKLGEVMSQKGDHQS